jgi:hypothetical protein
VGYAHSALDQNFALLNIKACKSDPEFPTRSIESDFKLGEIHDRCAGNWRICRQDPTERAPHRTSIRYCNCE